MAVEITDVGRALSPEARPDIIDEFVPGDLGAIAWFELRAVWDRTVTYTEPVTLGGLFGADTMTVTDAVTEARHVSVRWFRHRYRPTVDDPERRVLQIKSVVTAGCLPLQAGDVYPQTARTDPRSEGRAWRRVLWEPDPSEIIRMAVADPDRCSPVSVTPGRALPAVDPLVWAKLWWNPGGESWNRYVPYVPKKRPDGRVY